ncbi:hypothetical protein GCL60_11830 [Silvanigrella paludirubra]|uniref:Uncharacterized protein n=1 Tax=Silvanigrella paludirubra TaxID=2499159 RepID=A0A6N6VWP9_9BACT|nr:hypothetical protein [Silvanigrella paludirubra]KAB8037857.1 hypothetical protein GCL60_11830 [Silvanigrella paludirubra]
MIDLEKYKSNYVINKMNNNIEIKSLYLYKGQGIAVSITNEFRGIVVNLITNNNLFIQDLDNSLLQPPPPWIVYPNEDPRGLGSLQGEIDYWFDSIWNPFWNSLSLEEKKNYFRMTKPNRYWANYLMESPIYKEKI